MSDGPSKAVNGTDYQSCINRYMDDRPSCCTKVVYAPFTVRCNGCEAEVVRYGGIEEFKRKLIETLEEQLPQDVRSDVMRMVAKIIRETSP